MNRKHKQLASSRGVVMVLALLALALLAGPLLYVINIGQNVQRKVQTQNAVDAAAAGGAGFVARAFNTVAMNNIETARLISLANTLDAMPKVTDYTLLDQQAMLQVTGAQLARGSNSAATREALLELEEQLALEISFLEPLADLFNRSDYDVRTTTFYDGPEGQGHAWRAMEQLQHVSLATMNDLPALAQTSAVDGGTLNEADAFMLPFVVDVPWVHGSFDDFERPVMSGLLATNVDDPILRRGPYDAVYGELWVWRRPWGGQSQTQGGSTGPGYGGNVPIGQGGGGSSAQLTSRTPDAYIVQGPRNWMSQALWDMARQALPQSRLGWRNREISSIKFGYLWPGTGPRRVIEPQWETSWSQTTTIAQTTPELIEETAFIAVEIKSRYADNDPRFLSDGSWTYVAQQNRYGDWADGARTIWTDGWEDPRTWINDQGDPLTRINNYTWRDQWHYTTLADTAIGLEPNEDGSPHTVYRVDDFIFVGINLGEDVEVRNPNNFTSREALAGPVDFDHAQMDPENDDTRQRLTCLAIARRSNQAIAWPTRFNSGDTYPYVTALAQMRVFNNHSFDLWTPMWHAQLEPISQYANWVDLFEATQDEANTIPAINTQGLGDLLTYLRAIEPLAPVMLEH